MGYKPLSGKCLDHQTFHDLLMKRGIFRYRHPRIFTHLQNEDLRNGAQPLKNLGYEERALTKSERDQGS